MHHEIRTDGRSAGYVLLDEVALDLLDPGAQEIRRRSRSSHDRPNPRAQGGEAQGQPTSDEAGATRDQNCWSQRFAT